MFSSQVVMPLIVASLMIAIDERLPRALGLFAALSIVRFRMPIKSLRDMTFIFLSISIGICAGSGAIRICIIGSSLCLITLLFISALREGRFFSSKRRLVEVTTQSKGALGNLFGKVDTYLKAICKDVVVSETRVLETTTTRVLEVWLEPNTTDEFVVDSLKERFPEVQSVRILRLFEVDEASS